KEVDNAMKTLQDLKVKHAKDKSDSNTSTANTAVKLMLILLAIGVFASVGMGIFITSIILKQLGGEPDYVAEIAGKVAIGDVSMNIDTKGKDENSLIVAMSKMVDTIKALVADANMLTMAAT